MALRRSFAWMGFAQASTFGFQFAASVVLARFLTPYQMGVYAAGAATVGVLSVIQTFGLQNLIVREERLTAAVSATAFTINTLLALALSGCILLMSFFGEALLHDPGVRRVLLVLAVNPLFCIFDFLPSSNLERSGRFKEMALIGTAAGLMATIVTIAAAVLGYNYMSVAYAGWASGLLSAVLMNIVGRRHVNFRMGLSAWKRVAAFGAQMLAVSGINAVSLRLADLALGRMLGLGVLGIYNRASGLNGLLWNVHLVTGRVLFVEFANLNRRGAPLGPRYLRTVEIATAALWPAFAGFAVLAGPFILTVFGARWLPATAPLALLAVASMILVSITMTWELFAATNELKAQTRIEFIRAIVGLVLFVVGCMISLNAAAGARILDAAFAVVLYRRHLERMLQLSFSDFFPAYGRSALLTLLAIAPATVVMGIYRMSAYAPLPLLLCSVVAGVLLWGMGLKLLKHPLVEEGRLLLRRIRALPAANPVFADSEISDEAALVNAAQLQQQFP